MRGPKALNGPRKFGRVEKQQGLGPAAPVADCYNITPDLWILVVRRGAGGGYAPKGSHPPSANRVSRRRR